MNGASPCAPAKSSGTRHATRVSLRLGIRGAQLTLAIEDNGVGFDAQAQNPGHYGITGLHEQAALIGAALRIDSTPETGTSILITLPMSGGRLQPLSPGVAPRTRCNMRPMRSPHRACALLLLALLGGASMGASAQDPCGGFKWDVSRERTLFASSARPKAAGKDSPSAPLVLPDRLYALTLLPRGEVSFAAPPGRAPGAQEGFAGLAALKLPRSGSYRVSVDVPLWIDVAAGGRRVPPTDYQGQQNCEAPRKIVQFDLDAAEPLMLQFSGSSQATVRVTVTRTGA